MAGRVVPRPTSSSTSKAARKQIVVVELDPSFPVRKRGKPHLYVAATAQDPDAFFERLKSGSGPTWIGGRVVRVRRDLAFEYGPSSNPHVLARRLDEIKTRLSRSGHAVNGDAAIWRVYVLDVIVPPDDPMIDRGRLRKVVYVGQTSKSIADRVKEHAGTALGKSGRYLGSRKLRNRKSRINRRLTPKTPFYTSADAISGETRLHSKLESMGYRVLGDVVPARTRESS
jgi:hypothetical protein